MLDFLKRLSELSPELCKPAEFYVKGEFSGYWLEAPSGLMHHFDKGSQFGGHERAWIEYVVLEAIAHNDLQIELVKTSQGGWNFKLCFRLLKFAQSIENRNNDRTMALLTVFLGFLELREQVKDLIEKDGAIATGDANEHD